MVYGMYPRSCQKLTRIISLAAVFLMLATTGSYSYGAEPFTATPEIATIWAEIAYVRFQAAQGYEVQSEVRKQTAFRPKQPNEPATPASEFEIGGDEKTLACDEYQKAAKQWAKAAQGFGIESNRAKTAKENAELAWQAAKRTVVDAIELYRRAEDYYDAHNNLLKKTAVLGKIATNLERLIEINMNLPWSSVSTSIPTANNG